MKNTKHLSKTVSTGVFALAFVISSATAQDKAASTISPANQANDKARKLVWSDEFNGTSLDYSKWGIEENAFGGGNQELQIYTDRSENVRVEGGNLVLEARHDNAGISGTTREYSAGRVRTKNRGDWKYGRIEVRAKLPIGQGIWPAIWMLPTDNKYGTWASSGEIDIMEYRGQTPNEVLGTLHYGGVWPNNTHTGASMKLDQGNFSDDFHTFAMDWQEGKITWSVDGKPYQTQTSWTSAGGEFPAPFDQRFHLLLNLAVGGGFVGAPDDSTSFPQQMLIDFVRVYQ
ncbi:glycoside hydrolase family 16 protein [Rubripirellula reticaptiva]|uniref:Glucan endo-1,3-beta-glucosidase A1 n=1 Tax=Rubripirellula reticaptiva TaxID=2528013 RepID=A0A5C6F402_9BACT|nr:glycoside hydrolase family 16 protein [Rubripirellula reticaptiva]TWU55905.1 Glucan endo-1,3-beta-glucosidase A1 precursor [Rubripirellula reticaptiva]